MQDYLITIRFGANNDREAWEVSTFLRDALINDPDNHLGISPFPEESKPELSSAEPAFMTRRF